MGYHLPSYRTYLLNPLNTTELLPTETVLYNTGSLNSEHITNRDLYLHLAMSPEASTMCYFFSSHHTVQHLNYTHFNLQIPYQYGAIQIYQPTRCNNFSSLLLDVYVQLNMFRASSRPSSGAQRLQ